MEPTGRDARVGASVVGGKREFALSHPRIYPTPSSQGAGLRYHPCRPAPRPSVFSPAFFSPIGRPSRRPAGDAPFADRTRVGVRVLSAPRRRGLPLCCWLARARRTRPAIEPRGTVVDRPCRVVRARREKSLRVLREIAYREPIGRAKRLHIDGGGGSRYLSRYNCYERRGARQLELNDSE